MRITDFYDPEGNFVRQQIHWSVTGFVYNYSDPSYSLQYTPLHYTYHYYEATGSTFVVGLYVNVPGEGAIWHDAGRLEFNADAELIYAAGQHDYFEGNTGALCAALSP